MTRFRRIITSVFVLAAALLLLAGYLLYWLKQPIVQSILVKKALTEIVGKRLLHTEVRVGKVYIDVYNRLDIRDLYIEDWNCDTLLFAKRLLAEVDSLSLRNRVLFLKGIEITNPYVHFNRPLPDEKYNYQYLLGQFGGSSSKKTTPAAQPDTLPASAPYNLKLNLGFITLNSPRFCMTDEAGGFNLAVQLQQLHAGFSGFKPFEQQLSFNTVQLVSPNITLTDTISNAKKEEAQDCDRPLHISVPGWLFAAQQLALTNGSFNLYTGKTIKRKEVISFKNLKTSNIQIGISNLVFGADTITGHIDRLQLKEQSGFEVTRASAFVLLSPQKLELANLSLQTPNTRLQDYVAFKYPSLRCFSDFVERVKLDVRLKPKSYFTFKDIAAFAGGLYKEPIIAKNINTRINISGRAKNEISRISAEGLALQIGNTTFKGDVRLRGLPDFQSTNIDFKVTALRTNTTEIKRFLPAKLKLPPEIDKLGNLYFTGRFSGFPKHFVAEGTLNTNIGQIQSDVKMDIGRILSYSGRMAVKEFDLGTWLNKPDKFGKATFSANVTGKGVKLDELQANIDGNIASFTFNNYTYSNVAVNGNIDRRLFAGVVQVTDNNMQLSFKGSVDLNSETPKYNFVADVFKLRLKKLNLFKAENLSDDFELSGRTNLNLIGKDIDDLFGNAAFYDVKVNNGKRIFALDTVTLVSTLNNNRRTLQLNSHILTANVNGSFTFKELPNAFINLLHNYFPYRFKYTKTTSPQIADFTININNPALLSQIFIPELESLANTSIKGSFNSQTKALQLKGKADEITFAGNRISGFKINVQSDEKQLGFSAGVDSVYIAANKLTIPDIKTTGIVYNDSINFTLKVAPDTAVNYAQISGLIFANSDTLKMKFDTTEIVVNRKKWEANTGTFTYKNKDYFEIDDVVLRQDERSITLRSHPSRNYNNYTQVFLQNIYLSDFNYIPTIAKLGIDTKVSGEIALKDVFNQQIIIAELNADDFVFRKQFIGNLRLRADKRTKTDDLHVGLDVSNDKYDIKAANGLVVLPKQKGEKPYIDISANIRRGNLQFMEAFLSTLVSRTEGNIKGLLRVYGNISEPNFKGNIFVENGATTVNYLNTRYKLKNQTVVFDDKYIRFNNTGLQDTLGNTARANGFVFLNDLKNMSINLDLTTDNLLLLNTTFQQNNTYYGTAFGGGVVNFRGPFNKLDIYINARSNKGTKFYLPINYETDVSENNIYTFINTEAGEKPEPPKIVTSSGMNIEFDLEMTPDAEIQIIFDLQAGDIIKGTGFGDIQMDISTIGDFKFNMYGKYTIEQGSYLFTLQNIINKYFAVEKGGTVNFAGNPYDALLDVKAIYSLKTNRDNLLNDAEIAALIDQPDLKRRAPIDVFLQLTGSLLQPNIKFEIAQTEQPVTRVDEAIAAKLKELELNNQNELNKQVFGLLVLNSFMSPEKVNLDLRSGVNTTVSELLSNYLSSYLNQVVSGLIPDSEFNINWRNYTSGTENQNPEDPNIFRNEIELVLTKRLFNDRLSIQLGGNVDVGNNANTQSGDAQVYFAGDFVLEYRITPDGRYLLRAFNKTDYDILSGNFNKTGASLSVNQEFDSFKDLFKKRKKKKNK